MKGNLVVVNPPPPSPLLFPPYENTIKSWQVSSQLANLPPLQCKCYIRRAILCHRNLTNKMLLLIPQLVCNYASRLTHILPEENVFPLLPCAEFNHTCKRKQNSTSLIITVNQHFNISADWNAAVSSISFLFLCLHPDESKLWYSLCMKCCIWSDSWSELTLVVHANSDDYKCWCNLFEMFHILSIFF